MECYVEVTVLLGSALIFFSQLISAWMCHRIISWKKLLLVCWIAPVIGCLGENGWWLTFTIVAEMICALINFSFSLQAILLSWGVRFMMISCFLKLTAGRIVNFQLFVPVENQNWVAMVVIVVLLASLLQHGLGLHLKQTNYLYPVVIVVGDVKLHLSGYLDTGNHAVFSGYPVIFVDQRYEHYFESQAKVKLEIQTVQGYGTIEAIQAQIQIEADDPQQVWLTMSDVLEGCGYDSLLNMECFAVHR